MRIIPLITALLCAGAVDARQYPFLVTGQAGVPLVDVVIAGGPITATTSPVDTVVDQVDKAFDPFVSAVRRGTRVSFPNSDNIRHHVYSFSPAKTFEIRLYQDEPPGPPIAFDSTGVVALGCNIHDNMLSYVFVTDRPFFDVTDSNGRARFESELPITTVDVWHPALSADARTTVTVELSSLDMRDGRYHIALDIARQVDDPQAVNDDRDRFQRFSPE